MGDHISKELMETAGLDAGSAEQKKSLEIIMQIAAEVSKDTGRPWCILLGACRCAW